MARPARAREARVSVLLGSLGVGLGNTGTFRTLMWNGIHPPDTTAVAQYLELFAPNTSMFPVQTRLAHDELVK